MYRALQSDKGDSQAVLRRRRKRLDSGVFLGSQLAEISRRFPAHVEDIRAFLLKEKLPVPSTDVIPELSSRMRTDSRFRTDIASLTRAILYEEREGIGYEDLLSILVAAAAGTEKDLTSDSQETCIREMLRYLLQSRRLTFHPEAEESPVPVKPEARESVPVPEPVLVGALRSGDESRTREPKPSEISPGVAESNRRESDDLVLPSFRTGVLFAAQPEPEARSRRGGAVWIVGMVCMLLGVGLGLVFHRVVSAAEMHVAVLTTHGSLSKPGTAKSTAPKETAPVATAATVPAPHEDRMVGQSVPPVEPESAPRPSTLDQTVANPTSTSVVAGHSAEGSPVPTTVVKQVVTASSASLDGDETAATQITAATHSIVPRGAAGMMPANVIFSPAPEYPAEAAAARVHGEVTVHAVVDPDGKVIYARAVSGPPLLRDAAQEAVQRWRYRPLLDNGKPIAVTTVAIVDFKFAK